MTITRMIHKRFKWGMRCHQYLSNADSVIFQPQEILDFLEKRGMTYREREYLFIISLTIDTI